jgi:hypothetical protein
LIFFFTSKLKQKDIGIDILELRIMIR